MSATKKSTRPPAAFKPVDEQSLTNEWLLTEDVMKKLRCGIGTIKNLRKKKLLPHSKIGGLIHFNSADVQQMLVIARRRSFLVMMCVQWFGDVCA
ncbi:MAG TPA: helix-turn-helix domain-containing protein [Hanamia sp.]|nr:helix-turn-helix domain-containing protein [Hanamia sp.]